MSLYPGPLSSLCNTFSPQPSTSSQAPHLQYFKPNPPSFPASPPSPMQFSPAHPFWASSIEFLEVPSKATVPLLLPRCPQPNANPLHRALRAEFGAKHPGPPVPGMGHLSHTFAWHTLFSLPAGVWAYCPLGILKFILELRIHLTARNSPIKGNPFSLTRNLEIGRAAWVWMLWIYLLKISSMSSISCRNLLLHPKWMSRHQLLQSCSRK